MAGENELGRFMPFVDIVIEGQKRAANTMEAVRAQYEAIQTGVDRIDRRFSAMEQQQITLVYDVKELTNKIGNLSNSADSLSNKVAIVSSRVDDLSTKILALSNKVDIFSDRSETISQILTNRMGAILARLDEMEDRIDTSRDESRRVHLEIVGQYHEVLNAIQIGSNARSDLAGVVERIELLERKLGL